MDSQRRLGRVIERDHAVVIDAMGLGPVLRGDVRREGSDVPEAKVEDVGHGWVSAARTIGRGRAISVLLVTV